ncbi:MAG: pilus assembly FimT family protein [Terriglobia bacterium]
MNRYTARLNCLSRSRPRSAGYALIVLMIAVTVLLISLTAALPSVYQESQRHREEEAIFRGNQYARAVYLFHRKMGRFPVSVKDLLKTDNMRFLRQSYRDPLNRSGRWRFIHAAAGGILIDSWNQTAPTAGLSPHASALDAASGRAMNPASTNGSAAFGGVGSFGASSGGTGKGKPKHPPSSCSGPQDQTQDSSEQTGTLLGAFIVGVAPCNDRQSIRVLDHKDHYDHWEFLGLGYLEYRLPQTTAPNALHPLQPTPANQMGTPNQPGQSGQTGTLNGQGTPGTPPSNQAQDSSGP